jgi:hypothetical protein
MGSGDVVLDATIVNLGHWSLGSFQFLPCVRRQRIEDTYSPSTYCSGIVHASR